MGRNKRANIILDFIAIIMILSIVILGVISWFSLPSEIPNHMDSIGNVKDYVTKNFIFFPIIVGVIIGIGLLVLARYPEKYNYAMEITDKNREAQYSNGSKMIRVLNIHVLLIFGYMEYGIITSKNSVFIILILLLSVFITLGYYIRKSVKSR